MACIGLDTTGKNSISVKSKDLAICDSQRKIPDTPTKTSWSQAQFQKGQPTSCKTMHAFPAHLWAREFWPRIYSLWQALDWGS